MDVKVGHLSDPEDIPGLAHFCEHLMFMGTEKVRFSFFFPFLGLREGGGGEENYVYSRR